MGNFNRDRRGPRRDFGGGSDRGQMFRAVCDKCGKECEVPFRPTQGKPVFCSDCFRENGGGRSDDRSFRRGRFDNRNDRGSSAQQPNYKEQLDYMNAKLDKILRLLTPEAVAQEVQPEEVVVVEEKKKRAPKKAVPVEVTPVEVAPVEVPPAETPTEQT